MSKRKEKKIKDLPFAKSKIPPRPDWRKHEKRMDAKFSVLLRLKRNLTCERCNKQYLIQRNFKIPRSIQCSHYIGRAQRNTRWSYNNCFCHCAGCHRFFEAHPHKFRAWVLEYGFLGNEEKLMLMELHGNQRFDGNRDLIEYWIEQELMKELQTGWPILDYPILKPLYYKLGMIEE